MMGHSDMIPWKLLTVHLYFTYYGSDTNWTKNFDEIHDQASFSLTTSLGGSLSVARNGGK